MLAGLQVAYEGARGDRAERFEDTLHVGLAELGVDGGQVDAVVGLGLLGELIDDGLRLGHVARPADLDVAPAQEHAVHLLERQIGALGRLVLDEGEALVLVGLRVPRHAYGAYGSEDAEGRAHLLLLDLVEDAAHVEAAHEQQRLLLLDQLELLLLLLLLLLDEREAHALLHGELLRLLHALVQLHAGAEASGQPLGARTGEHHRALLELGLDRRVRATLFEIARRYARYVHLERRGLLLLRRRRRGRCGWCCCSGCGGGGGLFVADRSVAVGFVGGDLSIHRVVEVYIVYCARYLTCCGCDGGSRRRDLFVGVGLICFVCGGLACCCLIVVDGCFILLL